jgi:ribonuclease P protein subunit POP4
MRTRGNLARHELIGLEVQVTKSKSNQEGLKGKVVDETRNLLTIETVKGEKKVPKSDSTFEFRIPEGQVEIEGKRLLFRPEDRIKRAR